MYAIVDIAGSQFKVSKTDQIITARLEGEPGSKVEFENVLLVAAAKEIKVGTPYLEGAKVHGTIIEHGLGDKVHVFKKKRRKGFRLFKGHRQPQTTIKIDKIVS